MKNEIELKRKVLSMIVDSYYRVFQHGEEGKVEAVIKLKDGMNFSGVCSLGSKKTHLLCDGKLIGSRYTEEDECKNRAYGEATEVAFSYYLQNGFQEPQKPAKIEFYMPADYFISEKFVKPKQLK